MPEIKVGALVACNCDVFDVPYFITAYHSLWPDMDLYVSDRLVDWFENKKKFSVDFSDNKSETYGFRWVMKDDKGVCEYVS